MPTLFGDPSNPELGEGTCSILPIKELTVIKLKTLGKAFAVGFVGSLAVVLGPLQALAAKDLRMPCMYALGGETAGTQLSNNCSFPDSSDFRADSLSALNVHFQNSSGTTNTASAKACITYFNAVGGACGSSSSVSVPAGGVGSVSPSRSQWTPANIAHFKTIDTTLPNGVQVQGIFAFIP